MASERPDFEQRDNPAPDRMQAQAQNGSRSAMGAGQTTSGDRRQLDQQPSSRQPSFGGPSGQTPDPSVQPEQDGGARWQCQQGTSDDAPAQASNRSRAGGESPSASDQPEQEGRATRGQ